MVRAGEIGAVRKVVVEYNQGWLATRSKARATSRPRGAPTRRAAAPAGAIGDIGSHAENLVATVTGLEIESLCADLSAFVPGPRARRRRQPAAALRAAARAAC